MSTIIPFSAAARPPAASSPPASLPLPSGETPQEFSLRTRRMQIIHDNLHSPLIARLQKQNACLRAELARLKGKPVRGEV